MPIVPYKEADERQLLIDSQQRHRGSRGGTNCVPVFCTGAAWVIG